MMTTKSEALQITLTGGVANCIPLPAPPRGKLDRLVLKQVTGTAVAATFSIFSRRGACSRANDIVVSSGTLATVTNSGGKALLTFVEARQLVQGAKLLVKGCSVSGYNREHSVTGVVSDTQVLTDVDYSADGAGGFWQISPQPALLDPVMYLVHSGSVVANTPLIALGLQRAYENSDIRDISGVRTTCLWLELTPEGSGSQTWQVAISTLADSLV